MDGLGGVRARTAGTPIRQRDLGDLGVLRAGRRREGREPQPRAHEAQQSDAGIGLLRAANDGAQGPEESSEGRAASNGKTGGDAMSQARNWMIMPSGAERIRQAAGRTPKGKLTALLHRIAPETLERACQALKREAAPEDKILQRAMVDNILTPICETEGLGCSDGLRAERMTPSTRWPTESTGARSTGLWIRMCAKTATASAGTGWSGSRRCGAGTGGCCDCSRGG